MHFTHNQLDYVSLVEELKGYQNPRDKIKHLLRKGSIVRVKKGLYIVGDAERLEPICLEALANLVYGPSYVSYEYALSYYGLIPEQVAVITSATTQRNKHFDTPVGHFQYQHLSVERYSVGVEHNGKFLIASPEKALADVIAKKKPLRSKRSVYAFLNENLRIEPEAIKALNRSLLQEIALNYKNPNVRLLGTL